MREIKISLETATRWYNGQDEELKALAFQTYPELAKKKLPKTWKELKEVKGWYVRSQSTIDYCNLNTDESNSNIFATKEQAEASIAMAQLSQLIKVYNDGWVPDYKDESNKYGIFYYKNEIRLELFIYANCFLLFKDEKTAELFLENFRDLIEIAKPLL